MTNEFAFKQKTIDGFLDKHALEALVLRRASSFSWATCGAASYVNIASTTGEATLVITPTRKLLLTNNIEETRLREEERLDEHGWEIISSIWYHQGDIIEKLTNGYKTGIDIPGTKFIDVSAPLARTRAVLSPSEGERFRKLGYLCAQAMNAAAKRVQPGQTEYQIASLLAEETEKRGVQVIVNLIATDDRIFSFRHPLPTNKSLDRYAMLILCGRKWGLVCSITRLVHFGKLPKEVQEKSVAVSKVDAAFIAATRPGAFLRAIFKSGKDAYSVAGYPGEWKLHHQGGPAGYEPREYIAVPGSTESVELGQVFAWNPSITGTKSEDTILVNKKENEILTAIEGWPVNSVEVDDQVYLRPAILEL